MRITTRMRRTALSAALAACCAVAAVPAVAAADHGPLDPLKTNVPYLAWRGEQIKLADCVGRARSTELASLAVPIASLRVEEFLVEDWSGTDPDRAKPQIAQSSIRSYVDDEGRYCFAASVISPHAGIAPVKLLVTWDGVPVLEHQFLAIWMTQRDPVLTQLPTPADPSASGQLTAGGGPSHVRVTVSGTVPLLGGFGELGLGSEIVLPRDWPALAQRLARSDDARTDRNPLLWDVHDDDLTTEGHPYGPCGPGDSVTIDAVDTCLGGGERGRFSAWDAITGTAFLSSPYAIGPFDPTRADDTFLPDGRLTAGDAPMPALRVDVSIAPNSGAPTDASGIGTLAKVDKGDVYSRSGGATPWAPHDLYAPFYEAFIPATAAGESSSGIEGPIGGTNFVGFLNDNPYDFWDVAYVLRTASGGKTDCLLRDWRFRSRPYGPQSVVVYTDEHGEAQVAFRPGVDAYYDALAEPDRNDGCDLQGVAEIGTAAITAIGRYPYQPVTDPDHQAATTLTQHVRSLFAKTLSYEPKGTTAATQNVRILTAHAQDVDGSPFVHELVCFSHDANAEGIIVFGPFRPVRDPLGGDRLCTHTDRWGNAVVEVLNSNRTVTNVIAHFVDERLFRDIRVDFSVPRSSGGTPPPVPSVPGGDEEPVVVTPTGPGTQPPTAAQLVAAGLAPIAGGQPGTAKPLRTRIATAYLKRTPRGKAWVVLRVNGAKPKATVRIRVIGRRRATLGRITRSVATNRTVRIGLGRLGHRARTVRVTLR